MPYPRGNAPLPIREQLRISQAQLADQLGVTVRAVQAWESGEHIPSRIAEIAMEHLMEHK